MALKCNIYITKHVFEVQYYLSHLEDEPLLLPLDET
jgi:hypothetical protein